MGKTMNWWIIKHSAETILGGESNTIVPPARVTEIWDIYISPNLHDVIYVWSHYHYKEQNQICYD